MVQILQGQLILLWLGAGLRASWTALRRVAWRGRLKQTTKNVPLLLVIVVLTVWAYPASGQTSPVDKDSDITTDRPDVTEASTVVPAGSLQIENGLTWTSDHGRRIFDLSESLVRIGVSRGTELRVGVPDYLDGLSGRHLTSGFGDASVGLKQQLGPLAGNFDLAAIVALTIPTGHRGITSGGFGPFIKLPWSKELTSAWSVGGMQSLFWNTEMSRRNLVWEPAFYMEWQLTKPMDVFAEYVGDYAQRGEAQQIAHFGLAYKITPLSQVDLHFGFGLSHTAPNRFIGAGYSFRVDHLFRRRHG
jgi:hypothetical protein